MDSELVELQEYVISSFCKCSRIRPAGKTLSLQMGAPGVGLAEVLPGNFEREMDKNRAGHLQENVRQLLNDKKSQLRDLLI